jgi:hypothetical protein
VVTRTSTLYQLCNVRNVSLVFVWICSFFHSSSFPAPASFLSCLAHVPYMMYMCSLLLTTVKTLFHLPDSWERITGWNHWPIPVALCVVCISEPVLHSDCFSSGKEEETSWRQDFNSQESSEGFPDPHYCTHPVLTEGKPQLLVWNTWQAREKNILQKQQQLTLSWAGVSNLRAIIFETVSEVHKCGRDTCVYV